MKDNNNMKNKSLKQTKSKYYFLSSANGMKVPFAPGCKASSFPEEMFPRIKGKDEKGKPCIFIVI
jgi:hypothetical protein